MALETAKNAIDTSIEALDLFNKALYQSVPWKTLQNIPNEMDKFRGEYSAEAADLVADVKTHLSNGVTAYKQATKHVTEWCSVTYSLLLKYIGLFKNIDETKSAEQNKILIEMLDDGITKLEQAQKALGDSSSNFNGAARLLTTLRTQLSKDFNENSDYFTRRVDEMRKDVFKTAVFSDHALALAVSIFEGKMVPEFKARLRSIEDFYSKIDVTVNKSFTAIDQTNAKLNDAIETMKNEKIQIEALNAYASIDGATELRDAVIVSAKHLAIGGAGYRSRHRF